MGKALIPVLRTVIALSLVGSLFVQLVMVPLMWNDLAAEPLWGRIAFAAIVVLGILTLQVGAACVWRLLGMVEQGTVFTRGALRYVDVMTGCAVVASMLAFALAVLLAPGEIAPGVVGLVCGASLVLAGVALLIVVLRRLLVRAADAESELRALRPSPAV